MKKAELDTVIKKILNDFDFKIYATYDRDGRTFFLCNAVILVIDNKNFKISISFNVSMKPDISSLFILQLKEYLSYVIQVNKCFVYDKDGSIKEGEEAETFYANILKDLYFSEFMNEQKQIQYLYQYEPPSKLAS